MRINQGSNGGTVIINGGSGSGGATSPGGSNTNVQFNNAGIFDGDNGFQYDRSVSSVTIQGKVSLNDNLTITEQNTDPFITLNDAGSPGGGFILNQQGNPAMEWVVGGSNFILSVTTTTPQSGINPSSRIMLPLNSQKIQFTNINQNPIAEFDPLANSSFSIPVVISTLTIQQKIVWPDGTIQVSSPTATSSISIYSATSTASFPYGASFSTITFTAATKTDKYGAASGLCALYNGCIPASQYSTPTSSTNYVAATFHSGTTSYWQLSVPINDTFVDGSTITVNVVWTSTVTSGNVVWNFQALTASDTLTMDGTYGNVVSVTDTANLNQSFNRSADSGAITPAGPNLHSGMLMLQMYRGVSGSDTLSGDARLIWVGITYYVNKFSSR